MHPSSPRPQREGDSVAKRPTKVQAVHQPLAKRGLGAKRQHLSRNRAQQNEGVSHFLEDVILTGARPTSSPAVHGPRSARSGRTPRSRMHPLSPRSRREGDSVAKRPTKTQAMHEPLAKRGLGAPRQPLSQKQAREASEPRVCFCFCFLACHPERSEGTPRLLFAPSKTTHPPTSSLRSRMEPALNESAQPGESNGVKATARHERH
jgi:hypothetical protein